MKYFFLISVGLLFLQGCKIDQNTAEKTPYIVCSTSIIRDCVQQIVGDSIEVVSLMGPGIDPHSYNPRPSDVTQLNRATVVIYNGFHLEGKMAHLFERLGKRKPVFEVAAEIPEKDRIFTDQESGAIDPHIWFDTESWMKGLKGITESLAKTYPQHSIRFKTNFNRYKAKVEAETKRLRMELAAIPESQRVLITSHDAFHYFSRCFGVRVKALQGISTTQEPGVQDVIGLVDYITQHKVKSLFVEHSVSPKAISTVIESCSRKQHTVTIGGTLYSDALGGADSPGNSYLNMLNYNVRTLVNGLR